MRCLVDLLSKTIYVSFVVSKMMLFLCTLLIFLFSTADCLTCLTCLNVTSPNHCQNYTTCQTSERCSTTSYGVGTNTIYELGCKSEAACLGPASLVGRSADTQCSQCCAVDKCNEKLCAAGTQVTNEIGVCSDDPNYDCQKFSAVFSICGDIHHAKTVCRKWCGLCNLVDGGWSQWTGWSECDVTCENGQETRLRTCSDPAPAHGGLFCIGNKTEIRPCTLKPCPVHGGWSSWSNWTACSKSCGIGTQSRRRSCNNPTPKLFGDHCFGDNVDFRTCFAGSCADGGWSSWTSWSSCNNGRKTRHRVCDNPPPSTFGRDCSGNTDDWDHCGPVAFFVNNPNGTLIDDRPFFVDVVTNVGLGYDSTNAKFVCPVPGVYEFSISLRSTGAYLYCWLWKNGRRVTFVATKQGNDSYNMASQSFFLQLTLGDIVYLSDCSGWENVQHYFASSFSGALII